MIQFSCPKCDHQFRVPPEYAGKLGTCKKCQAKFRVPNSQHHHSTAKTTTEPASKPEPSTENLQPLIDRIREEFDGKVPHNLLNIGYQLSLLAIAFLMVLLPVAYIGLITGTCFGLYLYIVDILPGLMDTVPRGRAGLFVLGAYISPIIGVGIMILFMIKPIFFTLVSGRSSRQRSITKAAEPVLFEFVERICQATRSPRPKRIDINYDVNASASFRRGFRSLFSKDLVLTIGAPLFAGLNTRQMAGILAHEFGHFSQGGGMKSMYIIRSINSWFLRVVYQRDSMDESLDETIRDGDWRISLILMVGKVFVYVSRGILWLFMMVAHAMSSIMMRQMEYDADRYEAHVAGSDYFAVTCRRLMELYAGQQSAMDTVVKGLIDQSLVHDFPALIVESSSKVSAKTIKKLQSESDAANSSLFSTHPTDDNRIKAAKKYRVDGLFQLERPASELLRNFPAVCEGVTMDLYRNGLGIMLKPGQLSSMANED